MKLASGILLILLGLLIGWQWLDRLHPHGVVEPDLTALDQSNVAHHRRACLAILQGQVQRLDQLVNNWACCDQACRFVQKHTASYTASRLGAQTFVAHKLSCIYFLDAAGRVVWGETRDGTTGAVLPLPELTDKFIPRLKRLLRVGGERNVFKGILLSVETPMLVCVRPILNSAGKGPVRGYLMMGRFLDKELVQLLKAQPGLSHQL